MAKIVTTSLHSPRVGDVPFDDTSTTAAQAVPSANTDSPGLITVCNLEHSTSFSGVSSLLALKKSQGRDVDSSKNRKGPERKNNSSGRWTASEHEAFLEGLKVYGREWKKVALYIPTRTAAQIRSHAQKYFAKEQKLRSSLPDGSMPSTSDDCFMHSDVAMSQSFVDTMQSITNHPSEVESRVCEMLASLKKRYKQLEDRLQQVQSPPSPSPPPPSPNSPAVVLSGGGGLGPASAALALEQKSLRKAAEARYEVKMRGTKKGQHRKLPACIATERDWPSCARVSLTSMPSQGGFDSGDVIALSMLGCNLAREKIENHTKSSIKNEESLELLRERLQLIERPSKRVKIEEH